MKDELKHYGVLGMRWGIRRSGKSVYDSKPKRPKYPKAKDLSDEELKQYITRLERENNYKRLTAGKMSKAKKVVGGILVGVATAQVARAVNKGVDAGLAKAGEGIVKAYLKVKKG